MEHILDSRMFNVVSFRVQCWVLIYFSLYIYDIDQGIVLKLCKFADDTRFGSKVGDTFGVENLRADLKTVYQWSVEWQLLFNVDKCTVMHMGKTNKKCSYNLGNNLLKESKQERDLGELIDCNGKQFDH